MEQEKKSADVENIDLQEAVQDEVAAQVPIKSEESEPTVGNDKENTDRLPPNVVVGGKWWPPYVITFAVLGVVMLLVAWARGCFSDTNAKVLVGDWCDALFVPGILCMCFGLLVLGSNGGAFDMLTYGVLRLFELFKRDPIDRKYGSFYEYQQSRRKKKRSFLYLIVVGGVYLIVAVVLLVVYSQME